MKPEISRLLENLLVLDDTFKPTASEFGISKPGMPEPGMPEPVLVETGISKPGISKPGISKPDNARPAISKPEISRSKLPKPQFMKPDPWTMAKARQDKSHAKLDRWIAAAIAELRDDGAQRKKSGQSR